MLINYYGHSDAGRKREVNEDCFAIHPKINLVVLCDGMGGHNAGDVASKMIVETVGKAFQKLDSNQVENLCSDITRFIPMVAKRLISSTRLANRRIYNLSSRNTSLSGMGSTIVAVHFFNNHLMLCHVGDSRLYLLRNGLLKQLTSDHSWVNELLQDNEITEQEAVNFKQKNVITRALGIESAMKIDLKVTPVQKNDMILLCSDGLSAVVDDSLLQKTLNDQGLSLEAMSKSLISKANEAGGPDNITVVLAEIMDDINETCQRINVAQVLPEENEKIQVLEDKNLLQLFGKEKGEKKKILWF